MGTKTTYSIMPLGCLFSCLSRLISKKTPKLRLAGLCEGGGDQWIFPHKGTATLYFPRAIRLIPSIPVHRVKEHKLCCAPVSGFFTGLGVKDSNLSSKLVSWYITYAVNQWSCIFCNFLKNINIHLRFLSPLHTGMAYVFEILPPRPFFK